jgi:hypothetical protein
MFGIKNLFLLFLVFPVVSNAETCGQLEQIKGIVEVHRLKPAEEDVRKAITVKKVPFSIDCLDVVVTRGDSAARIRTTQTLLSLGSNTRITISTPNKNEASWIDLSFGKIRSFFQNKSGDKKGALKVTTPISVVGVRGTDFFTSFNLNDFEMRQATLTGEVAVTHKQTSQEVSVKSGEQAVARPTEEIKDLDKNIPKPKKLVYSEKENSLRVLPMDETTKVKVREASELAKKVEEFESPQAVQIIGPSEKWIPVDASQVPDDLKDIKNKF